MKINPLWYAALRSAMQALWGGAVGWLAGRGIDLPAGVGEFVVDTILVAGAVALVTFLIRWMESRTGTGWFDNLCRLAAKWIMAGLAKAPAYPINQPPAERAGQPVAIQYEDGRSRTAL